jgi:lysophospholipase L1-like esterase
LPLIVNAQTLERAMARLQSLQALAQEHGVRFVYLVPPSLNRADIGAALAARAHAAGIEVLLPYGPAEMPRGNFTDGLHLSPAGATDFTARVAPALLGTLQSAAGRSEPPAPAR